MKKIDKLVIKSFVGPFFLTFVVVVFILLTQYMLKYFDDFVGKGLGAEVFAELLFYFSINMTPVALPLAVLLSSLMTFGNLGEHFELTAIKGAGISLTRALRPLFVLVSLISVVAFLSNNFVVPKANLKAYSLLYDIKQKKPALDIREGVFYGGIPNFKIKINQKFADGETIKDVIIYDHSEGLGNRNVILADSGKMYTIQNDRYLMLELFKGNRYSETTKMLATASRGGGNSQFVRNNFDTTKMIFDLASFDLQRTKEEYFASHRRMQTMEQLSTSIDSMQYEKVAIKYDAFAGSTNFYNYHLRYDSLMPEGLEEQIVVADMAIDSVDSVENIRQSGLLSMESSAIKAGNLKRQRQEIQESLEEVGTNKTKHEVTEVDTALLAQVESEITESERASIISKALNQSRTIKNTLQINAQKLRRLESEIRKNTYESYKKITQALSCLIMFLIGAPLGSIIKRGGLGVPVLISVCFFIAFYVVTEMSRKWAEDLVMSAELAVWLPNIVLLPFGIVFLIQARLDARLLESDFYRVLIDRLVMRWKNIRQKPAV
ncbi:LptF/LptG family permease [Tunicatimonas pelagia]|uniref:LptF/LptG family permease n=1 Tax=Tunicatimonas pelagia TaxID=931531 RepID=UPI0026665261|nr:LptF/LptG family permease [Tunicatimonas pelagia]WKN44029.1 LptF/LptG family permease [Tunicatimonas pelagia]